MDTHQIPRERAADRCEWGRSVRERVSLESHAELCDPGSCDPVGLIQGQETSRLQSLVPLRHERMGASAFAFYRGSARHQARIRAAAGMATKRTPPVSPPARARDSGPSIRSGTISTNIL